MINIIPTTRLATKPTRPSQQHPGGALNVASFIVQIEPCMHVGPNVQDPSEIAAAVAVDQDLWDSVSNGDNAPVAEQDIYLMAESIMDSDDDTLSDTLLGLELSMVLEPLKK